MTYKSIHQAKLNCCNKAYSPIIFKLPDGSYDWFPRGHPVPEGAIRVSYWSIDQWINEERM